MILYKIMKKTFLIINLLFASTFMFAQQVQDSVQNKSIIKIKEKFPRTRVLNFEYNQSLDRSFDSELLGENFGEGNIKSQKNFTASANILLYKKAKWMLLSSSTYKFTEFKFENLTNDSPAIFEQDGTVNFHYFSTGLTSINFSTLFKKPVIYNSSIYVDGNNDGFQRIKGSVGFSLFLKRSKSKTIGIGLQAFIDPTVLIPVIPIFIYNQKFNNSKWELDAVIPRYLFFRRSIGENGRLSLGSTFGSSGFYIDVNNQSFADVFNYSQLSVKTGIMYEHRINDYLITTFRGGLQSPLNNRLTQKSKPASDYIYENTQGSTGYFQLGISIDPFAKKKSN